jgi:chromosome partitioning protein
LKVALKFAPTPRTTFERIHLLIITVGAEKGGVSKTRLATHIAVLAASAGTDVVLLDTDRQGSATSWSRIRNEAGVTPAITVLSLPPNPLKELISLSSKYELIVVDIGAQNYRTMMECALVSDLVLVPCGADQQEVESALKVCDDLKQNGSNHEKGEIPAYIVLTRVSPLSNATATAELRAMLKDEGVPVFDAQLAYRTAWLATGKSGKAVHELKGKERSPKAVAEMNAVYEEILCRINADTKESC